MKLILTGTIIAVILVVWWGIGLLNGTFGYESEYTDYTLIVGLQAVLIMALIGIFIITNRRE